MLPARAPALRTTDLQHDSSPQLSNSTEKHHQQPDGVGAEIRLLLLPSDSRPQVMLTCLDRHLLHCENDFSSATVSMWISSQRMEMGLRGAPRPAPTASPSPGRSWMSAVSRRKGRRPDPGPLVREGW